HTATAVALVGGGQGWARPGAVSLAHRGVLFLDECPELSADALEALRTPLEEGTVRLARSNGVVRYPARCQLVLAANPCPCAPARDVDCVCPPAVRRRYLARLSGPLLDRVDLHVTMHPPAAGALTADRPETSAAVADRVRQARDPAAHRWARVSLAVNAHITRTARSRCGSTVGSAGRAGGPARDDASAGGRGADRGPTRDQRGGGRPGRAGPGPGGAPVGAGVSGGQRRDPRTGAAARIHPRRTCAQAVGDGAAHRADHRPRGRSDVASGVDSC